MDKKTKEWLVSKKVHAYLINKAEIMDNNIENKTHKKANINTQWNEQQTITWIYKKESEKNEEYLDFEIFHHGIKYFIAYDFHYTLNSYKTIEHIYGNCSEDEMIEIIKNFYELDKVSFEEYLKKFGGEKMTDWW